MTIKVYNNKKEYLGDCTNLTVARSYVNELRKKKLTSNKQHYVKVVDNSKHESEFFELRVDEDD